MSIVTELKQEIGRVSKKALRPALARVRKTAGMQKKTLSDLRRRVTDLTGQLRALKTAVRALERRPVPATPDEVSDELVGKARPTGKMVKALRKRLGISQAKLAKLLGVSDMTIYNWESSTGRLNMRSATKKAFLGVRGLGVREVQSRLEAMPKENESPRRKKRPSRRAQKATKRARRR